MAELLEMGRVRVPARVRRIVLALSGLLCAAWLSDLAGSRGLYLLALVSGLTDVDAITLSSLRLFSLDKLALGTTVTAITLAMLANLVFKTVLAVAIGGRPLSLEVLAGMGAVALGLLLGLGWSAFGHRIL